MSQPTIASVERELVECQQERGRLIGQLREARAQAYEEIAEQAIVRQAQKRAKETEDVDTYWKVDDLIIWLRSESKRIRESK